MYKPLPPVDKFELNRMVHARVGELALPASPPGQSGHKLLHWIALTHFRKKSWSDLNVDQMKQVYLFIDANKRLPKKGELSSL